MLKGDIYGVGMCKGIDFPKTSRKVKCRENKGAGRYWQHWRSGNRYHSSICYDLVESHFQRETEKPWNHTPFHGKIY